MSLTKIAGLNTVINSDGCSKAVILLHGFGANCYDLEPLSGYLASPGKYDWYFPDAPLAIPEIPMGKAWFPLQVSAIDQAIREEKFGSILSEKYPDGFLDACKLITDLIEELKGKYEEIILGGFSQGAMVASHCAVMNSESISKILLMSGSLVHKEKLSSYISKIEKMSVFQSHGKVDPILPFDYAVHLNNCFKENTNLPIEFHEFHGGHEIPMDIINKAKSFLEK